MPRRRRVEPKRQSVYQFKVTGDDIVVHKWAIVRDESFEPDGVYEIGKLHGDVKYACNCQARVYPCRHIQMVLYCKAMGWTKDGLWVLWDVDNKVAEHISVDDICDRWNVPKPGEDDGSTNYDD